MSFPMFIETTGPLLSRPEDSDSSSAALDRVHAWQKQMVNGDLLGMCQVLISRRGNVVYRRSTHSPKCPPGGADAREDALCRIYSMTKPITAVALMTLFEEGKCLITDPVHKWLGEAWQKENMRVYVSGTVADGNLVTAPCIRDITLKHLLTHTAGLSYCFDPKGMENPVDPFYKRAKVYSSGYGKHKDLRLCEWVDRVATMPLLFQPGERWEYSVASDVLGRCVEAISGDTQGLDQIFKDRIFDPLGMKDTGFEVADGHMHRLATLYMRKGAVPLSGGARSPTEQRNGLTDISWVTKDRYKPRANNSPMFLSGGGGLVSTLDDYHKFAQMMMNGGKLDGVRVLSRKTVEFMTINHLPGNSDIPSFARIRNRMSDRPGVGQGLGVSVVIDVAASGQVCSLGSFAWGGVASTRFWVDPREQLVVVLMTQLMHNDHTKLPLAHMLQSLVYGSLIGESDATRSTMVASSKL